MKSKWIQPTLIVLKIEETEAQIKKGSNHDGVWHNKNKEKYS